MTTDRKIIIALCIAGVAALMFWARSCGIKSVLKNTTTDTVVTYTKGDTVYVPEILGVTNTIKEERYVNTVTYDTVWGTNTIIDPVDTAALLADYYSTRSYSDTQNLARGTVIIDDDITQNRIKRRRLQTFGTDTTINKVTILRPPRRIVGYWTLSGVGNYKHPVYGVGMGFGLKLPNERVYQVELKTIAGQRPMIEGRIFFPIRLIKQK